MRKITKIGKVELSREERLGELVIGLISTNKPITGGELAEISSHKAKLNVNPAEIRQVIREARVGGTIILGSHKGYKVAESKSEVLDYVNARKREIRRELKALSAMVHSFDKEIK